MDAMSDAIEGADVMLYGVSLAYKESANVRRGCYCLQLLFAVSPAALTPPLHVCVRIATIQCRLVSASRPVGRAARLPKFGVHLLSVA
jgi:hypothetical protein